MQTTSRIKKQTEADLKRQWGIDPKVQLRYKGLAGVYWHWLSRDIRKLDFERYGKCVSCPAICTDWTKWDCGHFVASGDGGFATRFMRLNLALQCKRCNNPRWCPDASAFFAIELDKRHGPGTAESLLRLKGATQKEMTDQQYELLIKALPSYQNRNILTT